MDTLMFVNGLQDVNFAFVGEDDSQYGKFMCVYTKSGMPGVYTQHKKCGFNSHAEAINWYLSFYPNGNVTSQESFLNMQTQLLTLKHPSRRADLFNPTFMSEKPRPTAAKRTADGKIVSEFE